MTLLGNLALWLALLVGIWGALAGFVGGLKDRPDLARSARHAVFAMCAALLVAVVSLEWALFQHDFNVEYVAAYTSRNLPVFYTWSALYAGQDRKSTRLNSSHLVISYAVFCLKKKN